MATTRLASSYSFLDVKRQREHIILTTMNHYASLTGQQSHTSHEKYSPLRAEKSNSEEAFGEEY